MSRDQELAIALGRHVRSASLASRRSQQSIGEQAEVSQALISKMELGKGGGVSLDRWSAVAGEVGLHLRLAPLPDGRTATWHRSIVDTASVGTWMADSDGEQTLLTRGTDRVVVHAWGIVTAVGPDIDRFSAAIERERMRGGEGRVSGIVVIPATGHNRRRVSELRDELRERFPARANAWYAALVNAHRPMPETPGIVWAFPDGRRLRPVTLLPGWIWTAVRDGPRFATGRRRRR